MHWAPSLRLTLSSLTTSARSAVSFFPLPSIEEGDKERAIVNDDATNNEEHGIMYHPCLHTNDIVCATSSTINAIGENLT